ncbi:CC_3452 family protein [Sphingomonas qomolangmaensis]|uniref:Uncharacterized protein n=1 Tax=Sphingomonas qomolangmaensis TaxID=2918765 RepID=A0ABY5L4N5_9SPHN|nr:hypothetical protein [Sphingomonas qomolangmaensis]UUL81762.1 hypothetical protein NMP03_11200 [Sphingomonas qomolangmaensis]
MRTILSASAVIMLALAVPAVAQGQGYYAAVPATPAVGKKLVTRDTIWRCGDSGCGAPKSATRPAILCELLVREVGSLQSFSVAGTAFDADALARCNAGAE